MYNTYKKYLGGEKLLVFIKFKKEILRAKALRMTRKVKAR
jgi:hypothetical protein